MPVLALVLATCFWGSSFITVGSALEYTNPLTLVMLRFGVAAFFVLLMLKGRIADIPKRTWKAGAACAFLIYLGYTTNAAGLNPAELRVWLSHGALRADHAASRLGGLRQGAH